jgi:hypothetical protein
MKTANILTILSACLALGLFPTLLSGESVSLRAVADTFGWEYNPTTKYGNDTGLLIGDFDGRLESFVRWDLSSIPAGSTIDEASIRLETGIVEGSFAFAINMFTVSGSWSEGSLTWNNRPGVNSSSLVVAQPPGGGGDIVRFEDNSITNWVQAIVDGQTPNNGVSFSVVSLPDNYIIFKSRSYTGDEPRLIIDYTPPPQPELTASPASLSFSHTSGSKTVTVTASNLSGNWTASANRSWISVSPTSGGNGTRTVTVSVTANSGYERDGKVTISGGGINREVTVVQDGAPFLDFAIPGSQTSYPHTGGCKVGVVGSNRSWSVTTKPSWITASPSSGNAGSFEVDFCASPNTSSSSRSGTITVSAGGISKSVSVTQAGAPVVTLTASPASLSFSHTSGSKTVTVTASNLSGNWTASGNRSWISVSPTSGGNGTRTVTVSVTANSGYERDGKVTISGGGINREVTVVQDGAPFLDFAIPGSQTSYPHTGGCKVGVVGSNRSWSVTTKPSWITASPSSGNAGSFEVDFCASPNTSSSSRSGTITVSAGGISKSVSVTQAGAPVVTLTASPASLSFSHTSGSKTVTVTASNLSGNWTASGNRSWISVSPTSGGNGTRTVTVSVTANSGYERDGKVTISGGGITREVTVNQAAPPEISINPPTVILPPSGECTSIEINSNVGWTISKSCSWVSISPTSGGPGRTLLSICTSQYSGSRTCTLTITGGGITRTVTVAQEGQPVECIEAFSGSGYTPGANASILVSLPSGIPDASNGAGIEMNLPSGWSYVSDTSTGTITKPTGGDTATVGWAWLNGPVQDFTVLVAVPGAQTGSVPLDGQSYFTGSTFESQNRPICEIVLEEASYHSADTNEDWRFNLQELLRLITLYNYREGTVRTGQFHSQIGTADGFAPGAGTQGAQGHSSDYNPKDWKINLQELLRLITLYNYREGTVRTGAYHLDAGGEDGFAPGADDAAASTAGYYEQLSSKKAEPFQGIDGTVSTSGTGALQASGGSLKVKVALEVTGDVSGIGLELDLPSGWSYEQDTLGAFVTPQMMETSAQLGWAWLEGPKTGRLEGSIALHYPGGRKRGETISARVLGDGLNLELAPIYLPVVGEADELTGLFPRMTGQVGGGFTTWLGNTHVAQYPWIWIAGLGWNYVNPSADGAYFYHAGNAQYWYSGAGTYPYVYLPSENGWSYMLNDGAKGPSIYSLQDQIWRNW